jgi:DHA1 family bicyclomycin/chloramphenicol resistance-like MFS transporter
MASSLQACIGSLANGVVAGVLAPLVMHSTLALALSSMGLMSIGVLFNFKCRFLKRAFLR